MNLLSPEAFLSNIRSALGHRPDVRRTPPGDLFPDVPSAQSRRLLARFRGRNPDDRGPLLEALQTAAGPINLTVFPAESVAAARGFVVGLASEKSTEWGEAKQVCSWRHPLIERLDLAPAVESLGIPVIMPVAAAGAPPAGLSTEVRADFAEGVRNSFIGLTSADYCVADTATLVMRTNPAQPRSVSLVPSIHVAVIRAEQLVADLKELYAILRWQAGSEPADPGTCLTFISGPSKTADIEATLVHGAHGPRELHLIVLLD
jgi:L-lactate dehydrogenase complex protein LldG